MLNHTKKGILLINGEANIILKLHFWVVKGGIIIYVGGSNVHLAFEWRIVYETQKTFIIQKTPEANQLSGRVIPKSSP